MGFEEGWTRAAEGSWIQVFEPALMRMPTSRMRLRWMKQNKWIPADGRGASCTHRGVLTADLQSHACHDALSKCLAINILIND